jgi:hypothetical protein
MAEVGRRPEAADDTDISKAGFRQGPLQVLLINVIAVDVLTLVETANPVVGLACDGAHSVRLKIRQAYLLLASSSTKVSTFDSH